MLILHHVFARLACRHAGTRVTSFMNYMVVSHIAVLLADEPAGGVRRGNGTSSQRYLPPYLVISGKRSAQSACHSGNPAPLPAGRR